MKQVGKQTRVVKETRRISRMLYLRDGGHDGRYRTQKFTDRRKEKSRRACRGAVRGEG